MIDTGLHQYITDTYISLATGQPCRTLAMRLEHASGTSFVLCIDQRLSDDNLVEGSRQTG